MLKQRIYRHFFFLENEERKLPSSSQFYIQKISFTTYLSYLDYLLIYTFYFFMLFNMIQLDQVKSVFLTVMEHPAPPLPLLFLFTVIIRGLLRPLTLY